MTLHSHDHPPHDHAHHDHASHDHASHDHHGHEHADHDHSGHDHDHGHGMFGFGHAHTHEPASFGAAFAIGITLNTLYIVAEAVWGVWAHSLSLLADAGHNLGDVLGLAAAWLAQHLARRAATARFTYGLRRSTILAALANGCLLLLVTGGIVWEAIMRLFSEQPVAGQVVTWVALGGIAVNGFSALLFVKGASSDLNIRGAFLHMLSDAVMAFAVVLAGLAITWTGLTIIDPIVSLVVSLSIVLGTWSLLRGALDLSLDAVPKGIDPARVENALRELPGVTGLHHLHIWGMSTTETALTVHLLSDSSTEHDALLVQATSLVRDQFRIAHPTFQIESETGSCDRAGICC